MEADRLAKMILDMTGPEPECDVKITLSEHPYQGKV